MANHLDHLLAIDRFTRESPLGCVSSGYEMHAIAQRAQLVAANDKSAARWTGELVELGYLIHGPKSFGDSRPTPPGRMWGDSQLQMFNDYRVTADGRNEADRMRRLTREQRTDEALGNGMPSLVRPWMDGPQQRAIATAVGALRAALDGGQHSAAIGAAKDLAEAACKVVIEGSGQTAPQRQSLPALFKQARTAGSADGNGGDNLGRSLAATVQRLAELRNAAGAGHGHASLPKLSEREALLAASAATAIADYLLADDEATEPGQHAS